MSDESQGPILPWRQLIFLGFGSQCTWDDDQAWVVARRIWRSAVRASVDSESGPLGANRAECCIIWNGTIAWKNGRTKTVENSAPLEDWIIPDVPEEVRKAFTECAARDGASLVELFTRLAKMLSDPVEAAALGFAALVDADETRRMLEVSKFAATDPDIPKATAHAAQRLIQERLRAATPKAIRRGPAVAVGSLVSSTVIRDLLSELNDNKQQAE